MHEDGIMPVVVPPPIESVGAGIQYMKEGLPLPTQDTRRSCALSLSLSLFFFFFSMDTIINLAESTRHHMQDKHG